VAKSGSNAGVVFWVLTHNIQKINPITRPMGSRLLAARMLERSARKPIKGGEMEPILTILFVSTSQCIVRRLLVFSRIVVKRENVIFAFDFDSEHC